jgi:ABC-type branched-subunit amino acid transport system substrate-binding protein
VEALSLSAANEYGFTNAASARDEATAFEAYLKARNIKNTVIVFVNNSWGEAQLRVYKEIAAKHGVIVLDELRSTSYDANEWNIFVAKIGASGFRVDAKRQFLRHASTHARPRTV